MSENATNYEITRDIVVAWIGQSKSRFIEKEEVAEAFKAVLKAVENPD
ncbi:hypothetical protein [Sporolactobacillus terrae]|nr:hypothetical protein [Sporolactobacillus terrae]